jgi:hypothetical protein
MTRLGVVPGHRGGLAAMEPAGDRPDDDLAELRMPVLHAAAMEPAGHWPDDVLEYEPPPR